MMNQVREVDESKQKGELPVNARIPLRVKP